MSCIIEMFRPCEYVLLLVMVFCGSKITQKGPFTSQMGVMGCQNCNGGYECNGYTAGSSEIL